MRTAWLHGARVQLPHLKVLRFTGNPQLHSVKQFRKQMKAARQGVKVFVDLPQKANSRSASKREVPEAKSAFVKAKEASP
jgi:hypothetical protein